MDGTALGTAAVVAGLLVPVVSFVKRAQWSSKVNYVIGFVAAFVAAAVGAVVDGNVQNVKEFIPYIGTAFATAQTVYQLYFGGTALDQKLTAIGSPPGE
jgi:hypothetical protein